MNPYYQDEAVTLYCGDCRDLLPTITADVVITDPPYGIGWWRRANPRRGSKGQPGIIGDADTTARDTALALTGGKPGLIFGSFYAPYPPDTRQVLVWHKAGDAGYVGTWTGFRREIEPVFLVGRWPRRTVRFPSLIDLPLPGAGQTCRQAGHPHAKPLPLLRYLLERMPPGSVCDPFAGSGSTLVAAKQLGRRAIGIEIEEHYCAIAAERLAATERGG